MRYCAVPFGPASGPPCKGWWMITDRTRVGWVLFAGGEQEVKRLCTSMNRDEAKQETLSMPPIESVAIQGIVQAILKAAPDKSSLDSIIAALQKRD